MSKINRRDRHLGPLFLGLSFGSLAFAACGATPDANSKSTRSFGSNVGMDAGIDAGIDAGVDSVSLRPNPARLTADVAWLADDARQGRRAGTNGERMAADYLVARLAELGLEPAGDDGYRQLLEVPLEAQEGGRSWVLRLPPPEANSATDLTPFTGSDNILPLFCSAGSGVEGPLVFAGYGMRNEDRDWDDYGALELRGALIVIVRGTPEIPMQEESGGSRSPHGGGPGLSFGNSGSIFNKVMTAKHLGASAVILAQHPRDRGQALLPFHNGHSASTSIPAITVSVEVASRLIPGFVDRVTAIDARAGQTGERLESSPEELGRAALSADVRRGVALATNVLALQPGRDRRRVVVMGAHFDHLGMGGTGSLSRATWGDIHNGADDNASGTAVVLELARILSQGETPPCDVLFALWSGEELGLLGSSFWVSQPTVPIQSVACNLNFDMVGRAGIGKLQVLGAGTSPAFSKWMESAGRAAGLELAVNLSGDGIGGSDHQSFIRARIPALHLFSGVHSDYHKPTDDTERFEAGGAARTVDLALNILERIGLEREMPFVEVKREESGSGSSRKRGASWSVTFGSKPSYGWDGEGLMLSGTSAGSPAERAGLLAGDVVLGIGDLVIGDIHDFVYALQIHKPGDVVAVRYLRDGREEHLTLTLGSRELE